MSQMIRESSFSVRMASAGSGDLSSQVSFRNILCFKNQEMLALQGSIFWLTELGIYVLARRKLYVGHEKDRGIRLGLTSSDFTKFPPFHMFPI